MIAQVGFPVTLFHQRAASVLVLLVIMCSGQAAFGQTDWPYVGGDQGGMRYSALDQINRANVKSLEVAWIFQTGKHNLAFEGGTWPSMQCTPVVVDGVMYLTSADTQVIALDAAAGTELWRFNPQRKQDAYLSNRGVAYWSDRQQGETKRILFAIPDGKLFSLDAHTGKPDPAFGKGGAVDLREGINGDLSKLVYGATSAPAIYEDLVIVGFSVNASCAS